MIIMSYGSKLFYKNFNFMINQIHVSRQVHLFTTSNKICYFSADTSLVDLHQTGKRDGARMSPRTCKEPASQRA